MANNQGNKKLKDQKVKKGKTMREGERQSRRTWRQENGEKPSGS